MVVGSGVHGDVACTVQCGVLSSEVNVNGVDLGDIAWRGKVGVALSSRGGDIFLARVLGRGHRVR